MTASVDRRLRMVLGALLVATAALYLWNLSATGYGNFFYAAAAQSGSASWSAWFPHTREIAQWVATTTGAPSWASQRSTA